MAGKSVFTRILAIAGVLFACFPILATIITAIFGSIQARRLRVDYLMPAELFGAALLGTLLLLWAAFRARSRHILIIWGLVGMLVLLFGSQGVAMASGLASGRIEPFGFWWVLVLALLGGYIIALLVVDVAGILLLRDLFARRKNIEGV